MFHSDIPHLEKLEIEDFFDYISTLTVTSNHETLFIIQMLPCSMIIFMVFVTNTLYMKRVVKAVITMGINMTAIKITIPIVFPKLIVQPTPILLGTHTRSSYT